MLRLHFKKLQFKCIYLKIYCIWPESLAYILNDTRNATKTVVSYHFIHMRENDRWTWNAFAKQHASREFELWGHETTPSNKKSFEFICMFWSILNLTPPNINHIRSFNLRNGSKSYKGTKIYTCYSHKRHCSQNDKNFNWSHYTFCMRRTANPTLHRVNLSVNF